MLYYAANITQLFQGQPLTERFQRIADAGFAAYELLFPQRENIDEVAALQERYGLQLALFDLEVDTQHPMGHLTCADEGHFFRRLDEALRIATKLGCRRVNALVGSTRDDISRVAQVDLIVGRLQRGADIAASAGVMLTVEALNRVQRPQYFLHGSQLGADIVKAVGKPNVRFQYDYYHLQIDEGNLIDTAKRLIDTIGHIQIADVPGRHEPGTGEINYPNVLKALVESGYDGYVGLEYTESSPDVDPFAWLPRSERSRRLTR